MKKIKKQTIAIIGGMGPEASAYLYSRIIDGAVRDFNAIKNDDFPEIILYSVPVPDFISNSDREEEAVGILKQKIEDLNKLNISYAALACNTAHYILDELVAISNFPFVSMIDEVVKQVKEDGKKRVGLLGTPSILRSSMYKKAFAEKGIEALIPDENKFSDIDNIIRRVISQSTTKKDEQTLKNIANSLKKLGAEAIVLGCTELPLIFPKKYSLPVYNSVEVLTAALLRRYYK